MPLSTADPDVGFDLIASDQTQVQARLRSATHQDVALWTATWKPRLLAANDATSNWDWSREVSRGSQVGYSCIALLHTELSGELALDGLMSLSIGDEQRSRVTPPAGLVYVEYIATAPHNRKAFGTPRIARVSELLLRIAIAASHGLEMGGRIGLHATREAEAFYREKLKMWCGERERQEDGEWLYFEGTPDWAAEFTSRR